eukprot:CAMPEP_0114509224 /NCGR_PEP_ID=MMETSP0109-20121206/13082_1 /TAXON_ID=29199 /ORGANISM="Chlorarachnion reptans, Strain CCCM449" /LENGTH=402 /DNA_ID=CAMNT_0001688335 /DNA_START=204 /DNA_END=1412 /DNA_ORIENTATION=+
MSPRFQKIPYAVLIFFSILVALIVRSYHEDFGFSLYGGIKLSLCGDACRGDQAVYRICLALTLFFGAHCFLVTLLPYSIGYEIHTTFFGVKSLLYIGMVIGMFYIDQQSMNDFADTCRIISLIFLVFQTIAIIDYAYTFHFWMIDKEDQSWDIANLALSGLMYSTAITVIGFLFKWFAAENSCGLEKFVLSMTIIVPALYTAYSCTEQCQHGALFPSAAVTGYITYIAFTAMLSSTNSECNTFSGDDEGKKWELAIGIIIAAASVTFTTWNVGSTSSKLFGARNPDDSDRLMVSPDDDKNNEGSQNMELDDDDDGPQEEPEIPEELARQRKYDATVFHFLMTVASMYACMLLTSWSTDNYGASDRYHSAESFWVKVASQWLVMILYVWTLVAPVLFPDRDFT